MSRKKKIIQVSRKNIDLLADKTNMSTNSVWGALAYRSDSKKAQEIRQLAISEYGGIETYKLV